MTGLSQHLTVRVPEAMRDADGVRLDAMLAAEGMVLIRELPRIGAPAGHVDLLVEDTSAPGHLRGTVVGLVYDEHEDELSFDRWEPWTGPTAPQGPAPRAVTSGVSDVEFTDAELEAELARRRAARETAAG